MTYDAIIVGGSYAGMAAALQLVRARRTVLVIDAGRRRNRFANHAHGFLGQDGVAPGDIVRAAREQLDAYIEDGDLARIDGRADVHMGDGRMLSFAGLFVATRCTPSSPLAEGLGCAIEDTPMGLQIRTDAARQTSVKGVFACGDVARVPHSLSLAVADGAWAGAQVHRSLVFPD